jgi:hypothetical protein
MRRLSLAPHGGALGAALVFVQGLVELASSAGVSVGAHFGDVDRFDRSLDACASCKFGIGAKLVKIVVAKIVARGERIIFVEGVLGGLGGVFSLRAGKGVARCGLVHGVFAFDGESGFDEAIVGHFFVLCSF